MSILQYLANYAEPESACPVPPGRFANVVVLPAFDETHAFVDRFATFGEDVLWLVVVNASEDRSPAEQARTAYLVRSFGEGRALAPGIHLHGAKHNIVVVDRATEGRLLPKKSGVGLARKIGCDMALAWGHQGVIDSPWIHWTDCDAQLPADYFEASAALADIKTIAALAYPFWHAVTPASVEGRALEIYEMSLRYYVLGLHWAGSPYAFHSIGSTIAVRAEHYLAARGVPKREAGEDFYLLGKVAKLGKVVTPRSHPIVLDPRDSRRTPFGTGRATAEMAELLKKGEAPCVYAPASFALLRQWLDTLDAFAKRPDMKLFTELRDTPLGEALPLETEARLRESLEQAKTPAQRKRRLDHWFDGFKTLKLIHALRDRGLSDRPWREAFDAAPFVPEADEHSSQRQAMVDREAELAAKAGDLGGW